MIPRSAPGDSLWSLARRQAAGPAVFTTVATIGFAIALLGFTQYTSVALHIYVVVVGVMFLWLAVGVLSRMYRSSDALELDIALRRKPSEPRRPLQLEEIEQDVRFAGYTAPDYDRRLRPVLRELAADRLATNHHINAASEAEAARSRLGEPLWQAAFGEQRSVDREAPGPSLATLRSLIEALESL